MDIARRLNEIDITEVGQSTRKIVIDVLEEVLEKGHDLGGMGEYGRGWNDSKMQTKMIVKEMIERWKNES